MKYYHTLNRFTSGIGSLYDSLLGKVSEFDRNKDIRRPRNHFPEKGIAEKNNAIR